MHRLLKHSSEGNTLPAASSCFPSAAFTHLCMHLTVACRSNLDFLRIGKKIPRGQIMSSIDLKEITWLVSNKH